MFKYLLVSTMLNCSSIVKPGIFLSYLLNINHQEQVIKLLRGFPVQMLQRVRQRPCLALLRTLASRLRSFNQQDLHNINMKAEYALFQLPLQALPVGINAVHRNHWLFPVIVVSFTYFLFGTSFLPHFDIFLKLLFCYFCHNLRAG